MTLSSIVDVAVSGLAAQRVRMAVAASNLANAETTRTAAGGPYRRRDPVFEARPVTEEFGDRLARHVRSVRVPRIQADPSPPQLRFDPEHPDADEEGYVRLPNVNPVEELVNMMAASRSFEADLFVLRKARQMGEAVSQIGR